MKTVLLTAVGSMAAGPIFQRLKELDCRVVGCDIYPREWNAVSMAVDDFFQAELATHQEAYLAQLREAVVRYRADFLIPLTDPEVDTLCPRKAEFAALGCTLCVPEEKAARLCRVKTEMNRLVDGVEGCRAIPTFDPYGCQPEAGQFPIMLKPVSGRSSLGQVIAGELAAYRAALSQREDYIAQPYLTGPVWTVDLARDSRGGIHAAARQELLRNPSGLGMTVQVFPGHPLEAVCGRIAEKAGIVGVVNMEFIEHQGTYFFLEVNPRYSGGVGFSLLAGMDAAADALVCYSGDSLGGQPALRAITAVRESRLVVTRP